MASLSLPGRRWRSGTGAAMVVFALVVGLFMNQSMGVNDWKALRDDIEAHPEAHPFERLRTPFRFLYRRSHDEELYFAAASQMLGAEVPAEYLTRGDAPPWFSRSVPADGKWHWPYLEVPIEYPPLAIPFVLLPRLVASSFARYAFLFSFEMGLFLFGAVALALRALERTTRISEEERRDRWWMASAVALTTGSLLVQRLDAVVALLASGIVLALAERRRALAGALLGLAGAAKLLPVLLAPVVAAADPPLRKDGRLFAGFALAALAGIAVPLAPAALVGGLGEVIRYHSERGLQVESTYAVLDALGPLLAGHRPSAATLDHGAFSVHGPFADACARVSGALTVAAVVAFAVWVYSRVRDRAFQPVLVPSLLVGMAILWLTGKVFSPQYLTWAFGLVFALPGKRGRATIALYAATVLAGQIFFRGFYDQVFERTIIGVGSLLVRDGLLVWLVKRLVDDLRAATSSAADDVVGEGAGRAPLP